MKLKILGISGMNKYNKNLNRSWYARSFRKPAVKYLGFSIGDRLGRILE